MPNAAYHDRAHERVPQLMRYHRSGERIEFRPCPLRPEVELWPFEGPYATTWLAARGDTVRLLTHFGAARSSLAQEFIKARTRAQIKAYVDALEAAYCRLSA